MTSNDPNVVTGKGCSSWTPPLNKGGAKAIAWESERITSRDKGGLPEMVFRRNIDG